MKRVFVKDIDWRAVQQDYDLGFTTRQVIAKYKISNKSVFKAKRLGLFKTRTVSESQILFIKNNPRDYSEVRKYRSEFSNYRADCSFKFDLKDFPKEFNFKLIEECGWYKAANKGNNLTGVSRDHIVSVRYGFDNKIDPKIISHPANCQLLMHNKNASKGSKCELTLNELIAKIDAWNNKYCFKDYGELG